MLFFAHLGGMQTLQADAMSSCVDIFDPVDVQEAVIDNEPMPCTATDFYNPDATSLKFTIEALYDRYLALDCCDMVLSMEITTTDNTIAAARSNVGFISGLAATMWRSLDVYINDKHITGLGNEDVGLQAYIEFKNSYGHDARHSHLQPQCYFLNTPGKYQTQLETKSDDAKYISSNSAFKYSNAVATAGMFVIVTKPPGDIFHTERLIPPGTRMTFKYTRHPNAYVLLHPDPTGSEQSYK